MKGMILRRSFRLEKKGREMFFIGAMELLEGVEKFLSGAGTGIGKGNTLSLRYICRTT